LTIKSTSHTKKSFQLSAFGYQLFGLNAVCRALITLVNATLTLAPAAKPPMLALTCVLLMPVNIQLSKISIAAFSYQLKPLNSEAESC
jgi:hypothetical protein